ncbi:hypothetical protein [Bacillus glycinifermentans]|uniref:hypothetical protein n=1 Tax=Bacillus glycinifermentans TaxID=1664069 RepID=UPI0013E8E843|nr:hypothetical protein [Bacillus glycinifermentans]
MNITEDQIFVIENCKVFGEYTVKRVNISDFEVIKDGVIVFEGEDYEVVDYLNTAG